MLEKAATKLTAYMVDKKIVCAEDEEVYVYGWSLIFSTLGSVLVMLLVAVIAGEILGTLIFMAFMFTLRPYAGGYHANTYLRCFLLSITSYTITLSAILFWSVHFLNWALVLLLFSVLIIFMYAPVDHPNKPLKDHEKQRNKIISRIVVSIQATLVLCLRFLLPDIRHYLLWAMLGMTMTGITLLYVILKPYDR